MMSVTVMLLHATVVKENPFTKNYFEVLLDRAKACKYDYSSAQVRKGVVAEVVQQRVLPPGILTSEHH
jgi:hypothetical protein